MGMTPCYRELHYSMCVTWMGGLFTVWCSIFTASFFNLIVAIIALKLARSMTKAVIIPADDAEEVRPRPKIDVDEDVAAGAWEQRRDDYGRVYWYNPVRH